MYLDIGVVVIYMGAMLLLGWYGMRRAKTQEDFLVAGRNLGPASTWHHGGHGAGRGQHRRHGAPGLCPRHFRLLACAALGAGIVVLNLFLAKPLLAAHLP